LHYLVLQATPLLPRGVTVVRGPAFDLLQVNLGVGDRDEALDASGRRSVGREVDTAECGGRR